MVWDPHNHPRRRRDLIPGVDLTGREVHYVKALMAGVDSGLPGDARAEVTACVERKCREARVDFRELLRVMGLGDLEMAAALARGCTVGDDRDRAFFLRIVSDRERARKKGDKGFMPAGPGRPRAGGVVSALGDNDKDVTP